MNLCESLKHGPYGLNRNKRIYHFCKKNTINYNIMIHCSKGNASLSASGLYKKNNRKQGSLKLDHSITSLYANTKNKQKYIFNSNETKLFVAFFKVKSITTL